MNRIVTLTLIIFSLKALGQVAPEREINLSILSDELIPYQDGDGNHEELADNLVQLLAQPIELNTAAYEDLHVIPFLTEKQIQHFLHHRETNGKLISIYELQSIPEFDGETIQKILPFVQVKDPSQVVDRAFLRTVAQDGNSYLITRYIQTLERKAGFDSEDADRKFLGPKNNLYVRARASKPGQFSFGFTADQDAGEKYRWSVRSHQYGFDHVSFHGQILNKSRLKNLVVGDYQCQFGQGLILGGGFGIGKGAETITSVKKNSFGFVPYTSLNEAGFMRGAAVTIRLSGNLSLSAFYSHTLRDATIKENDSTSSVSSFLFSGLHRNRTELLNRKQVLEENYGGILEYRRNALHFGIISNHIRFGEEIVKRPTPYNQFTFQGRSNLNVSVYANYNLYNYNFFTETARTLEGGFAVIAGMIMSPHPKIDVSMLFRNYDRNFYTFYSNAFSESSVVQNERGLYWGWKYHWKKSIVASGYADLFTFPWLGFRRYAALSSGHEWLLRFQFQPSRKVITFVQVREELKDRNSPQSNAVYKTAPSTKRNYVINFDYTIHPSIRLQTRAQVSTFTFDDRGSSGSVIFQDVHLMKKRFKVTARYALFDARDFDNRQYVYENDVWLAYSMPVYEGVGIRSFVVLQCKISRQITLWARYARTRYSDRNEIGSGLETITGNVKNDIKLQARITL
jgi:hypothetical protein